MSTRTLTLAFVGEVKDLQAKAKAAKSAMEDAKKGVDEASDAMKRSRSGSETMERTMSGAERAVQRFKDEVKQAGAGLPAFEAAVEGLAVAGDRLKGFGSGVSGFGRTLSTHITAPVVGAVGAVAGLSAGLGFKRLVGIDTARGQFKGLRYDAEEVMKQVDAGVTGTALSMADGAGMAVGILATGAVPMKDLEAQIKRVSNVSAAYGLEASHAGNLLNRTLTKGKVEWGDLSQMQENQIPIVSQLADHYNVSGAELQKMVQDGKVSIEDLNTVLDKNAGAAAEEYAKTWQGVTSNIKSNLGRIGASVLGEAFEVAKVEAGGLLELLRSEDLGGWAKTAGAALGQVLGNAVARAKELIDWWNGLSDGSKRLALSIAGAAVAAGPFLMIAGRIISGLGVLLTVLPKIVTGIKLAGLAFKGLGAAMLLNPIGLIITGVAALTAGLVWFFTQTETGRELWSQAWEGIQAAAAVVVDWWQNTAMPAIAGAWAGIQTAAASVMDWYATHIEPVFTAVGELIQAVVEEWIRPTLDQLSIWWGETWGKIKAAWDIIGPPLMAFISAAFEGMKIILGTIWNAIKIVIETVLGVVRGIIQTVTRLIRGDWSGAWEAIKATFSTIWDGTKRLIENAINGVGAWLSNAWDGIKNTASALWGGVRDSIMGVIDPLVTKMSGAFERAKDGIGGAMDKVRGAAAKPINFVIGTIWNNGLRAALNLIPGVNLDRAALIPGFDRGGWTGPGARMQPAGIVHADEYVFTKPEVRAMGGPSGVERWKTERLHGLPGYANGGAVRPVPGGHSGWRGGRYSSGKWHGGLDFPAGTGTPIQAMWPGRVSKAARLATSYGHHAIVDHGSGMQTLYAHMSRLSASLGQMVEGGGRLGAVGSTGNSTGPHLHLEVRKNGQQLNPEPYLSGAEKLSILDLPAKISAVISSIRDGLSGPWGDLIRGGVMDAIEAAKKWGLGKLGIGGYRHGVRRAPRGPAWVGEGGPELMYLDGQTVVPHAQSMDLAAAIHGRSSSTNSSNLDGLVDRLVDAITSREVPAVEVTISEGDIRRIVRTEIRKHKREGVL